MRQPLRLPEELVGFVEGGVSVLVGTCDRSLRPCSARAEGISVHPGRSGLTVFLPPTSSVRARANLEEHPQIAIVVTEVATHRSVQLKGRATAVREARDDEQAITARYRTAVSAEFVAVGIPLDAIGRLLTWPCFAVEVELWELFEQTPGPGAGARIEGRI